MSHRTPPNTNNLPTIPVIPTIATQQNAHYNANQPPSMPTSPLNQMNCENVIVLVRNFIKSYQASKLLPNFDKNAYCDSFKGILDRIKQIFDHFSPNNKEQTQILDKFEKELSPLLCDLICKVIPPNFAPPKTTQLQTKKDPDIKLQILQWIHHSKYLSLMQLRYIVDMAEYCIYSETEEVAMYLYENIFIPRMQSTRSRYKQCRGEQMRQLRGNRSSHTSSNYFSGKTLFEHFMIKENQNNIYLMKALYLLVQLIQNVTKHIQNPEAGWLKQNHHAEKTQNGTSHLPAMDSHCFILAVLQSLKYIYWIIEAAVDIGEYYEKFILNTVDNKMKTIRLKCSQSVEFNAFKNNCNKMENVFDFLKAIIEIYKVSDQTLQQNGIEIGAEMTAKIRIYWLRSLIMGLQYMYANWMQHSGVLERDGKYWEDFKNWEVKNMPSVITATFGHIAAMRNNCSNEMYCKFLKVIATNCMQLTSFSCIASKEHFKFICDSTLFLGATKNQSNMNDHHQINLSDYGNICLNEALICKFDKKYWFYSIVCSFWLNSCPHLTNTTVRNQLQKLGEDYKKYTSFESFDCQVFNFSMVRKSIAILLSIVRNQNNSANLQQSAVQALTNLIKFIQQFRAKFTENSKVPLKDIYQTVNTTKWVLEGKLSDIDEEIDRLLKILHVRQYQKYVNNEEKLLKTNDKKRKYCDISKDDKDAKGPNMKKRKLNSMDVDSEDQKDEHKEASHHESWIDDDYKITANMHVTPRGVIELESEPIQVHGDKHKNPDWILYEIEVMTHLILRCIRYCKNFESDLKYRFEQTKQKTIETEYDIYNDVDIHRSAKAFGTYLRILRIYSIPHELAPQLHIKTREVIIDSAMMNFLGSLKESQARSVWAANIDLLVKLSEAYPHSDAYTAALVSNCKLGSDCLASLQSQRRPQSSAEAQNLAIKSFIACDAYLGYLLANLDKLLGDDENEKILLNEFYDDDKMKNNAAIQFIEEHFFKSSHCKEYYQKYKDQQIGHGFIIHYDAESDTNIRIPTYNGFILAPKLEENNFMLYARKYLQYQRYARHENRTQNECKMDIDDEQKAEMQMVSYLDYLSDDEWKLIKAQNVKKQQQFVSTRWIHLPRHQRIVDTTGQVIRALFKLFMQVHQLQYGNQMQRNSGVPSSTPVWKGIRKLYADTQQMITHYAKQLIFKCITLSFHTSHCFAHLRLLRQIMTKCIENQFVGLLVPFTNFIIPSLVCLSNAKSTKYNNSMNALQHQSDNSAYKILSFIPKEFQHILCKSGECALVVTTDPSLMSLPYIQQLMIPILEGLKLKNATKYPELLSKSLTALNSWFESLTIPSIESLLNEYGDRLCRSLCKIIQKSDDDNTKKQAIRVLGKLGGNNRRFLEKSSSMKHEASTLQSITLDFTMSKENDPKIIDISFSNIIDEALDLTIKAPSSKTIKKRLAAMKTMRGLLTTLVWNEEDFKDKDERMMKNFYNYLTNKAEPNEMMKVPPLQIPMPVYEKMHLLKRVNVENGANGNNNNHNNNNRNLIEGPEIIENFKSFEKEKIVKLSEEKLKTTIMSIIIASADNDLAENRDYLLKLSKHFALLCATQPIQELIFEQDDESHIFTNMQSSKYLTNHLHSDVYLDAILTVLMSQNILWKYAANIALIQFLDVIAKVCLNVHLHPQFVMSDQYETIYLLQIKKYRILIRHILKKFEHHVSNNTDAVLDGIVMGLTSISFNIQCRGDVLSVDVIEQFLMMAIKAARYTFIDQNDQRRHEHLDKLTNEFVSNVYNTLSSKNVNFAMGTFKKLGKMVTKMHLVPAGSREIMFKILGAIKSYTKCEFIDFIPVKAFSDGLLPKPGFEKKFHASSRLCGFFETISWAMSHSPPLLKVGKDFVEHLIIAQGKLSLFIRAECMSVVDNRANAERVDPITKQMNMFLEKVEDYSANIRSQLIIACIRFISGALTSEYWKKITPRKAQPNESHKDETIMYQCLTVLIDQLVTSDKKVFDETCKALLRLKDANIKIADIMNKNRMVVACKKSFEHFSTCFYPIKIKVVETLYKLFGAGWSTDIKIGSRTAVHFREWLNHFAPTVPTTYPQMTSKTIYDAKIPVILAQFFEHIPENEANDDEISEVDPKTSKPLTVVDRIMDSSLKVIAEFEMKTLWPYISCYVQKSSNTVNPLHRSIAPFLNKHAAKCVECFLKAQGSKRLVFYKQQLFLSVLSLPESRYFAICC